MVQVINNTQNVPLQPSQPAGKDATSMSMFGNDGMEFTDLIDVVNPLHHIPVVNTVYRQMTGDEIGVAPRLAGSTLFGGVFGLAASAINIGIEAFTGKDVGEHAWNFMFSPDDTLEQDPTGAGGQTEFAKNETVPAAINRPANAPAQSDMPAGFVNLVNNKSWAAVGTETNWTPGQAPVAINRPAATEVAMNYQQQMAPNVQNGAQPALPASNTIPGQIQVMNRPVNNALPPVPPAPVASTAGSTQSANTRPAITPLAPPSFQATPATSNTVPLPQPIPIEAEELAPVSISGRKVAAVNPGAIAVSKDAPGMIPQPTDQFDAKPAVQPAGDPSRNPIPDDLFSATEQRYNAAQEEIPVFGGKSGSTIDNADYLVPDFKPSQVINHTAPTAKTADPQFEATLPPLAEDTAPRTLSEVARSKGKPDWARQQATGLYQQNMNQPLGGLYGQASYSGQPIMLDTNSKVTPLTWSGSRSSAPGLL